MIRWSRRAVTAALVAVAAASALAGSLPAQQAPSVRTAPSSAQEPAGPRLPAGMPRVEASLESRQVSAWSPAYKKDTTVITISTLGLILILVVIILLLA